MDRLVLDVRPLPAALGAEVHGVDAAEPPRAELVLALKQALAEHGLLVLRDQRLAEESEHVAFAAAFGDTVVPWLHGVDANGEADTWARAHELAPRPAHTGAHPSCTYFVNGPSYWDRADDAYLDHWHADVTYLQGPLHFTFAYSLEAPDVGYETWFADQRRAYDALDGATKARIEDLVIAHDFREAFPHLPPVLHKIALPHPRTGRRAIYGLPGFAGTSSPVGIAVEAGRALMRALTAHLASGRFVYRHAWRRGDLLAWDNRCLVHRRGTQVQGQTRVLRRVPATDGDAHAQRRAWMGAAERSGSE